MEEPRIIPLVPFSVVPQEEREVGNGSDRVPTHVEARRIAGAVRKELRDQGLIEETEHTFTRLEKST